MAWRVQSSYDTYDEHDRFQGKEISSAFSIGLSPMLGYKFASNNGFTVEIEFGALMLHAVEANESDIFPYGDINVGWSF